MHTDILSPTLAALSDPTRRAIIARLAQGEATVTQLTAPLAISMPAVSRHLKVLESAGLIERARDAQFRPCRLRPQALQVVESWLDEVRAVWDHRLDRLEAYLAELQAADRRVPSTPHTRGEVDHDE